MPNSNLDPLAPRGGAIVRKDSPKSRFRIAACMDISDCGMGIAGSESRPAGSIPRFAGLASRAHGSAHSASVL